MLDRHNLPHEVLPGFDTRYTAILQDVLEDPEAPIVAPAGGKEIEFQPATAPLLQPLREGRERQLLRLRKEYHLMDDKSWEVWRPKLERLIRDTPR